MHARRDRRQNLLPESTERYIWRATRRIVEELHAKREAARARQGPGRRPSGRRGARPGSLHVLAVPVRDEADELGLLMLEHLVDPSPLDASS